MREKKGILIVVSGFSGAGKGTLMKKLMQDYDNYALSISATTRQPRVGEEDGREYFFKTKDEFEKMIARDELIEYARYVENYYGTPKQYVMEQLEAGKDVILEIEIQGALKVKEKYPDTLLMFVTPPSAQELKDRNIRTFAAHLHGKNSYDQESYTGGTAFLIGNEGKGLTDEAADSADCLIRIPMCGKVESLNAAMASGILMYEAARQRR